MKQMSNLLSDPAIRPYTASTLYSLDLTTTLQMPTGAFSGAVMTSDSAGNATWQAAASPPAIAIHLTGTSNQIITSSSSAYPTTLTIPTMGQTTTLAVHDPGVASS